MATPGEPSWELLGAAALIPSLVWVLIRRRVGGLLALTVAFVSCLGIGAIAGKVRSNLVAAPILKEQIGPVRVEGTILEVDASERSRRVLIDVRAIEGLTPDQTPRYVRFSFKGGFGPVAWPSGRVSRNPVATPETPFARRLRVSSRRLVPVAGRRRLCGRHI